MALQVRETVLTRIALPLGIDAMPEYSIKENCHHSCTNIASYTYMIAAHGIGLTTTASTDTAELMNDKLKTNRMYLRVFLLLKPCRLPMRNFAEFVDGYN